MDAEERAYQRFLRGLAGLTRLQVVGAVAGLLEEMAIRPDMLSHLVAAIDDEQLSVISRSLSAELARRTEGG